MTEGHYQAEIFRKPRRPDPKERMVPRCVNCWRPFLSPNGDAVCPSCMTMGDPGNARTAFWNMVYFILGVACGVTVTIVVAMAMD